MDLLRVEEVDPEDLAKFQVGDEIFGRAIVRIDRERNVVGLQARPGRVYRFRQWLKRIWWLLTQLARG